MSASGRYVYVLLNADRNPLYVGSSKDPAGRIRAHRLRPWGEQIRFAEIEVAPTAAAATELERSLIRRLQPPHNIQDNPRQQAHVGRRSLVVGVLRECGPMTQCELQDHLQTAGVDNVRSFVGVVLDRLRRDGEVSVVERRPAIKGRHQTANVYALDVPVTALLGPEHDDEDAA